MAEDTNQDVDNVDKKRGKNDAADKRNMEARLLRGVAMQVKRRSPKEFTDRKAKLKQLASVAHGAIEHRKQLLANFNSPSDILAKIPRTVDSMRGVALTGDGRVIPWQPAADDEPYSKVQSAADGVNFHLADVVVNNIRVPVHSGVLAIAGPSGTGKSPLAQDFAISLATTLKVEVVSVDFGEPFAGYDTDEVFLPASILYAIFHNPVVILDSLKDIVLESGGAAGKGGLSRVAQKFLSRVSIAASNLGAVVIVPLNPSSSNPDVLSEFYEAIRSSNSGFINHQKGQQWAWSVRPYEGGERVSGAFTRNDSKSIESIETDISFTVNSTTEVVDAQSNAFHNLQRIARNAQ